MKYHKNDNNNHEQECSSRAKSAINAKSSIGNYRSSNAY